MTLTSKDEQIVMALNRYHYLTLEQIRFLFYSPKSSSYVNKVLFALVKEKYLKRTQETVNSPFVYSLGYRAVRYLRTLGIEVDFIPSEHSDHKALHLLHSLEVSTFLIAGEKVPAYRTGLEVISLYHDLTLRKMLSGRVVPDGFIEFREEQNRTCIWLELDRGTEEQAHWRAKIRMMVDWINQSYTSTFDTTSINIAVATTAGPRRCEQLQSWTEKELGVRSELQWFLFASIPPGTADSHWLFLEPVWKRVGTSELVSLL